MLNTEVKYTLQDELSSKLSAIETKMSKFDKLLESTDNNIKHIGKNSGTMFDKLLPSNGNIDKMTSALDSIPNLNLGIASSAGAIANPYVLGGAAVVAFGAYTMDAIKISTQWDKSMAKANVTLQETPVHLKEISEKIAKMAENSTTDFMQVPEAFNKIVSGIGNVDKSMDLLKYSLIASKAGFTDINTVADAGVNIMNSVGNKVSGANEVYDVLFATLNKGKGEFKDIADYLPRIIPMSNALGTSFKETAAMFAFMTAQGQTTEQTTMLLQNAFTNLLDGKKREKLEKFVKIFDDHGKVRSMVDIVGDMAKKTKGLADQDRVNLLDKFGFDAQAAQAFSVLVQDSDKLKDFITFVKNSSDGEGALAQADKDSYNASQNIELMSNKWMSWKRQWGSENGWFTGFTKGSYQAMDDLEKFVDKTKTMFSDLGIFLDMVGGKIAGVASGNMSIAESSNAAFDKHEFGATQQNKDLMETIRKARVDNLFQKLSSDKLDKLSKRYGLEGGKGETAYDMAVNKYGQEKADKFLAKLGVSKPSLTPAGKGDGKHVVGGGAEEKKIRDVAAGGTQIRNVTVNIGKQIEKLEVITTNMQDASMSKIRKILEELLVTSIRDTEIGLAN